MTKKRMIGILTVISIIVTSFAGVIPASATLGAITTDAVTEAILHDAANVVETVCTSNSVTATEAEGIINVSVSTKDLVKHKNGEDADGYWTGFAVVAPEGATKMKAALGTTSDVALGGIIPVEEYVSGENSGVAFYVNAAEATPKTYAKLQWFDESETAISAETIFNIDLSNVTLDIEYIPEIAEAKVYDKDNTERTVYASYTVTETEGNVIDIDMTELALHTNGEDAEGYWTGFAVVAPEGATQMKAALGTTADVALSGLLPVEENISGENDGIAFYADINNPKTYAKVQWFNENNEAISNVMVFTMNLSGVETCQPDVSDVVPATLKDEDEIIETVCTSNSVSAAEADGTINVSVSTKDLEKHKNGEGAEGYWTGFAVIAPEGATQMKAALGTTSDVVLSGLLPVEENIFGEDDGIAFYVDAGLATHATFAKLQWFDMSGEAVCEPVIFEIDLSDVTLAIDYTPEVIKAKIQDKDDTAREIYETYEVSMAEGTIVDIDMTELAVHTNGEDAEGYWTGFAVVAPEGATQMKAALGTTANVALSGLLPVEENISDENSGIAFYVDASASEVKKYAKLQWFDASGNALSNVTEFTMDVTDVKFNWIKSESVSAAVLTDTEGAVETLCTSNAVTATQNDEVIDVVISTKDLASHKNGEGTEGYWTGFAVVAPDGATQMKAALGTYPDISLGTLIPVEEKVLDENDGVAFYTDAGSSSAATYAKLQWYDSEGNAMSAETSFVIDLSGVTLEGLDTISAETISEAKIVNQDAADVIPYASYSVNATESEGKINAAVSMSSLKSHKNAVGSQGYWTGFAVKAPENATQFKYVFDTTANADWSNATLAPAETDVAGENDGAAFYTDVSLAEPKTVVMLQWFDAEGNALSNVTTIEMDLSVVSLYREPVYSPVGGGGVSYYTIKFETNGGSKVDAVKVSSNKTVAEPATPEKAGFIFEGWYADKGLTQKYDFSEKVKKSLTLYAKWTETDDTEKTDEFTDVDKNSWYYDEVNTVVEKGLMNGVSKTEFAPDMNLTRGMFVTVLYRIEGEPEVTGHAEFDDVADGKYYADAVIWATENGIVEGISDTEFMPEINITREQMATIIYRYIKIKGIDTSVNGDAYYNDSNDISDYAIDAIVWATNAGILNGDTDGNFAPQRNAARAEAAAVFVRLLNVIE